MTVASICPAHKLRRKEKNERALSTIVYGYKFDCQCLLLGLARKLLLKNGTVFGAVTIGRCGERAGNSPVAMRLMLKAGIR
ncbi:hypothetical protein PsAD46_00855 [Pseudovibrio sp. Ad46]|uniref:hypothetical protein n=1 Tax=Pseudovibrio sp. Ad46 TaxID=989432 RepID=UPI0007AEB96A|nr:hypothetical protein [Pseudovibrio sp. Ad46]KZK95085.1 hypothetical protein PsAD46_00855 [Pseudovibrio sp. Ad46]